MNQNLVPEHPCYALDLELSSYIQEALMHLAISLLSLEVQPKFCRWLDFNNEDRRGVDINEEKNNKVH